MSVIIRLKGLPLSAASADIRTFFCGLRIPDGAVNIVGGEEGEAFIGFANHEDARVAMRKNFGTIHNTEVRLFLSSLTEMNEVIDNARSVPSLPLSSIGPPPTVPPRYRNTVSPPRTKKDEPSRFTPRPDHHRFGRDVHPYQRNVHFGKPEESRYGRDGPPSSMNGNGRPPFPPTNGFPVSRSFFGSGSQFEEKKETVERGDANRSVFQIQPPNFGFEKTEHRKSDEIGMEGRNEMWMNGNRDEMNGIEKQVGGYHMETFANIGKEGDRRFPDRGVSSGMLENRRDDGDKRKEESWRSDNKRSFDRQSASSVSNDKDDEPISFFGRGTTTKRPLLPSPSIPPPSFPPPMLPSHLPSVQAQKEELFVELTRLPSDLIRPTVLEQFLSPSTPLTLSSVKVVYSPEGIHLSSLVRFTSALDAFNALKKDGEQGVKIRPSTKELFESARDGLPPPTLSHLPPSFPPFPHDHTISHLSTVSPIDGIPSHGAPRLNLFTMPLMNPNEMMMGERIEGGHKMNEDRVDRRRREEDISRGRREDKRRRSMSPRTKKAKGDRVCVHLSNLPFRVKEQEIRRMLGPGLNPYAIKKIFNEDNAPSDQWIMEFSSEPEAIETIHRRMELGGRQARMKRLDEPEADKLLRQKFKSPPRRVERDGERRNSFDEKVRMQQEAIAIEKSRMNGSDDSLSALAGAFSAPVFTTNRGFMRGGRGGGGGGTRGIRTDYRGMNYGMRGGRGRGGQGTMTNGRERGREGGGNRNCLLVSNMPSLPSPQILLEHLRIIPSQFVRIDQIAPDAAIIELRSEADAIGVAEIVSGELYGHLNGRRLIVAAMARIQIEEEFNLRGGQIIDYKDGPSQSIIDPELVRSIGEPGCGGVILCHGLPRDLSIETVKSFFDGFSVTDSSVRMRMEGGEGTGECILSLANSSQTFRAVASLNNKVFRGEIVTLSLI